MMKSCEAYETLMAEVLFGTPEEAERERLSAHLAACPACAAAFQALSTTLEVARTRARPEPSPAYWETFTEEVLAKAKAGVSASRTTPVRRLHTPLRRARARSAWRGRLVRVAAAVVLVAVGVGLGRTLWVPQPAGPDASEPAITAPAQPASAEARAQAYLARSKVLLLGLVNFEVGHEDPAMLNLPHRKAMARGLMEEAHTLKASLDDDHHRRLRELIGDLEVILMQIANIEAEHDVAAIEMLQDGMERNGLLFKINLEALREPSTSENPAGAPPPAVEVL